MSERERNREVQKREREREREKKWLDVGLKKSSLRANRAAGILRTCRPSYAKKCGERERLSPARACVCGGGKIEGELT